MKSTTSELFSFPRKKHLRTQQPPKSSNYRSFKSYLRDEFSRTCVYCRMPEWLHDNQAFAVDHYRPKSKFPFLTCEYSNLYFACNACNTRKGAYWPDQKQYRDGQYIVNPCDYRMNHHLSFAKGTVKSASTAGSFTVDLLDLNDDERIHYRDQFLECLKNARELEKTVSETLANLRKKIKVSTGSDRNLLETTQQVHRDRLRKIKSNILWLTTGERSDSG